MYTIADFALIEKGLGIAKDKEKYLESFGVTIVEFTFGDKYESSLTLWKGKQIVSYKQQLHKEYIEELKPAETDLEKKLADVRQKMETNRKRRREYD